MRLCKVYNTRKNISCISIACYIKHVLVMFNNSNSLYFFFFFLIKKERVRARNYEKWKP